MTELEQYMKAWHRQRRWEQFANGLLCLFVIPASILLFFYFLGIGYGVLLVLRAALGVVLG